MPRAGACLDIEVVEKRFAEEENQRYKATFLGSGALIGDQRLNGWISGMPTASRCANNTAAKPACASTTFRAAPRSVALPWASSRCTSSGARCSTDQPAAGHRHLDQRQRALLGQVTGMASHAGTTPMDRRRDFSHHAAEIALFVRTSRRANGDSVGTVGDCGCRPRVRQRGARSLPVQPGPARATDAARRPGGRLDAGRARAICERRGVHLSLEGNHAREAHRAQRAPTWRNSAGSARSNPGRCRCACPAAPTEHEAARSDAPNHALRARSGTSRHQPQPA